MDAKVISSAHNPTFRKLVELTSSSGLKEHEEVLLSGEKLVHEFLSNPVGLDLIGEVIYDDLQFISGARMRYSVSKEMFKKIDPLGTDYNILLLKPKKMKEWSPTENYSRQVFLPLGDPKNLGAAIRSCEAFGVSEVVLLKEAAHPFLPQTVKASSGSVLRISFLKGPSIKDLEGDFVALDKSGQNLHEFKWPTKWRILVGEEGPGVPARFRNRPQYTVSIPIANSVESLNATVALGITLFSACQP